MSTLATFGICLATLIVARLFDVALPEQSNLMLVRESLLSAFRDWSHFIVALKIAAMVLVVAPVFEELVFRGLLYRLPSRWLPHWLPMILSSVLFSAAHYLAQPFPDNAFVALAFFGMAQCWLYRRSGRIWCAMLNHLLFNLTTLLLVFYPNL